MVDFRALLSPEQRAQHDRHRARLAETIALPPAALLAHAIHHFHNAGDPRGVDGSVLRAGEPTYTAGLHHVVLPEVLRRLAGGRLPAECPMQGCGAHVDWDAAFVEAGAPKALATSGTQRDRARTAVARLYACAIDVEAFRTLAGVLDAAQNGGDGSIDKTLWTGLRMMANAFAEVRRVHRIMGRGRASK